MKNILVADDSTLIVKALEARLQKSHHQHHITTASTGKEAIQKWRAVRPSLTILDIHMPHLSGIEVLQMIRDEDPDAKVVMLTADRCTQAWQQCKKLGVEAFVLKGPGASAIISDVIERVLPTETGATA